MDWIRRSLLKASLISAVCFISGIVFYSVACWIGGNLIKPVDVILLFLMFIVIGVLNFIRFNVERTKWAMSKPAIVKNIIFAPLFYVVAIVFVSLIVGWLDKETLLILSLVFLVTFLVSQIFVFVVAKHNTDKMNDALEVFRKEHFGDEQE